MYREVSPELLLALMSAKLEPLACFSDGRWRSSIRQFPLHGISREEIDRLLADGLAEKNSEQVVLTERGTQLLRGGICVSRQYEHYEAPLPVH